MVDVFEEVEDQLRTERYLSVGKKILPWVAGILLVVIVVVGGYWGWDSYQTSARTKASVALSKAMEAQTQRDEAKAFTDYGEIAKGGPAGQRTLALMQQGGMRLEAGSVDEAVKFFDQAAKASPSPLIADWASLRSVYALFDTAPYADVEGRLTPLAGEKRPFRLQAKEALAMLKIRDGKLKEARNDFVVLSQVFEASDGMRQRAKAAIALIDSGSASVMASASKLAATLPPPPQQMQLPPGMQMPPEAGGPQQ